MSPDKKKAAEYCLCSCSAPKCVSKPTNTALGSHANPHCGAERRGSSPAGIRCAYRVQSYLNTICLQNPSVGEGRLILTWTPILTVSQQCSGPVLGQASSADPQGTLPSSPRLCTEPHLCIPPAAPSGGSASGLWWLLHGWSSADQLH